MIRPEAGTGGFLLDAQLFINPPFAMTLLDRLVAAYERGCRVDWEFDDYAPMRETLRELAEWMSTRHSAHSGAYIAQILEQVAGPREVPDEPHPSLTAQERNPNLK